MLTISWPDFPDFCPCACHYKACLQSLLILFQAQLLKGVKEAKCDNIMQDKTPLVSLDDIREDCIGVCQIGVLYDGGETFGQEEREDDLRMSTDIAKHRANYMASRKLCTYLLH